MQSWAIKFDMDPQTTDPSRHPHISIHSEMSDMTAGMSAWAKDGC